MTPKDKSRKDESPPAKSRVLFLCTANACRSQMAEAILRHLAGDRFEVASAGTHPSRLDPRAVESLREIGIDATGQRSKGIEEMEGRSFDYVITVCDRAHEECPIFPATVKRLHWSIEDPAGASGSEEKVREEFRRCREEIKRRIEGFLITTPQHS